MRLILMRHGKAEDRKEGLPDKERRLTSEGRSELNKHLPSLARYLNGTNACYIWASDYRRAKETAQILIRYMPGQKVIPQAFIGTGDVEALKAAMRKIDHLATVVIVGHEPYLSQWVEHLAQRKTRFKKGDSELLQLKPKSPEKAIRMGKLQLRELTSLEPLGMPLPVGMKEILFDNQRQILDAKDTFAEDVENDESVHNLRILLRKQKALLTFIQPFSEKKAYRAAQRAYSDLLRNLAHLRELDVLVSTMHHAPHWELTPAIAPIMAERNSEALRLDMYFSEPESDAVYADAYDKAMIAVSTITDNRILYEIIPGEMQRNYYLLTKKLRALKGVEDPDRIHRIRVMCKHHRYLYERFAPIARYRAARRYDRLKRAQRVFGNYCDTFYNVNVLRALTEEMNDPKISRAIAVLDEQQRTERIRSFEDVQACIQSFAKERRK